MRILIAGASGNLGAHIARTLLEKRHELRLLLHKTPLPQDLETNSLVRVYPANLADADSLSHATKGVDCIVYAAGVLFRPNPAKFLPLTNTEYVRNLVNAATKADVSRFVLVSFPHVEENTNPEAPALGILDAQPKSIHARTRLDAEKYLFGACHESRMEPIVLRAGIVYGPDMKLIVAAPILMRYRLFAVWRKPTWIHLLALPDFLHSVEIAVSRDHLRGIYNICDDYPTTLQDFVDSLATHWGYRKPPRLPARFFQAAAITCEIFATLLRTATPLTRDMLLMGMTSVVADTSRMKQELNIELLYPSFREGLLLL